MPDLVAICGTWQILKAELAGEEMPAFVAEKIEITFNDEGYVVRFRGEVSDRGTFELDASQAVKTMRLAGVEGTNAGRTIPAIYQLTGNRLRICYGLNGVAPEAFATTRGGNTYMATYRRI
jgi:uncharacterized protein (TIGR03067 family)